MRGAVNAKTFLRSSQVTNPRPTTKNTILSLCHHNDLHFVNFINEGMMHNKQILANKNSSYSFSPIRRTKLDEPGNICKYGKNET